MRGEWSKKTPDGKENTLCNICITASYDESTTFKDPSCYLTTEVLVQHTFSQFCPE